MRIKPLKIPSFKRALISLNLDLEELYANYEPYLQYGPLTRLEKLVLALEDRRYFSHPGIDPKSIIRELIKAALMRKHGGASTIDMQFVRTVNARREMTLRRKTREMALALLANFHFDKKAMLRSYLRIAFFGSGLNGVQEASLSVFGIHPERLSMAQAAQLAAMLVYPKPLSPDEAWLNRLDRRAVYGLTLLPGLEQRFDKIEMAEHVEI